MLIMDSDGLMFEAIVFVFNGYSLLRLTSQLTELCGETEPWANIRGLHPTALLLDHEMLQASLPGVADSRHSAS